MANLKTTEETTISPLVGTEQVRLAVPGSNGKTTTQDIANLAGVLSAQKSASGSDFAIPLGTAAFTDASEYDAAGAAAAVLASSAQKSANGSDFSTPLGTAAFTASSAYATAA